jgi:phosphoadenosine phosphosulfate reductase
MDFVPSEANESWARLPSTEILRAAKLTFQSGLALGSHCAAESALLLHLVTRQPTMSDIPVVYIYEEETIEFAHQLEWKLKLNLHTYRVQPGHTKLQTMQLALKTLGATAILHGIRRYQNEHRSSKKIVEHGTDGFYRIHPILDWTPAEVSDYFEKHDLPYHPTLPRNVSKKECGIHRVADTGV